MWIPHVFLLCRWVFYCVLQVLWQFPSGFYQLQYWVIGPEDFSIERIICRWDNLKATYNTNKVGSLLFMDLPVYNTTFPIIFFFLVVTSRFFFISDLDFQAFFFQNIRVCDLSTKGCAWSVPVRRRMTSVTNFGNQHFPLAQGHAHCQTCHSGKVVIGSDCKAGEVNTQTTTVCHQLFMFCRDAFDFSHWQRMQMDDSCIEPFQN